MQDEAAIRCPYCGEGITVLIDASPGAQRYIEDCQVCCRPIVLQVDVDDDGTAHVHAASEDDG